MPRRVEPGWSAAKSDTVATCGASRPGRSRPARRAVRRTGTPTTAASATAVRRTMPPPCSGAQSIVTTRAWPVHAAAICAAVSAAVCGAPLLSSAPESTAGPSSARSRAVGVPRVPIVVPYSLSLCAHSAESFTARCCVRCGDCREKCENGGKEGCVGSEVQIVAWKCDVRREGFVFLCERDAGKAVLQCSGEGGS